MKQLLQEVLQRLDLHSLLKCRLLSKHLKDQVDLVAPSILGQYPNLNWNPYFTTRRYFDLHTTSILGMVRLESTLAVKKFVDENTEKGKNSGLGRSRSSSVSSGGKLFAGKTGSGTSTSRRPAWNSPQGASKSGLVPSKSSTRKIPTSKTASTPKPTPSTISSLFPLGSLYIRRRLADYPFSATGPPPTADLHPSLLLWTTRLLQSLGHHLTSFTLDTGKRSGSDLTFVQLRTLLQFLPSLQFLGISAGNYEHTNYTSNLGLNGQVETFSAHPHLRHFWLGYNTTYHLHMDILNAFGSQLQSLSSSKFGYYVTGLGSSINSLQKLLDYVTTLPNLYPSMLTSLEYLKCPVVSTDSITSILQNCPQPLRWSRLRTLSLCYTYISLGPKTSHFEDLLQFLDTLPPSLHHLYLDFCSCVDFIQWLSTSEEELQEQNPAAREDLLRSCLPNLRNLSVSSISLLRPQYMATIVSRKFKGVKNLTFFNWTTHYQAEAGINKFLGIYFSGGPKTPEELDKTVQPFWRGMHNLQQLTVLPATFESEWIYRKNRANVKL